MSLYVNTLPLELAGFGIGSYTRDFILGLGESRIAQQVRLLCPPWLTEHPTVVKSGLMVKEIRVPSWIPMAVRRFVWSELAGWWLSTQKGATFFSSARHASFFAPVDSWVTCHDCLPTYFPVYLGKNPFRRLAYYRGLRFLHRCKGVITDSNASKVDITKMVGIPQEKVHVVYCWASAEFSPAIGRSCAGRVRKKYYLPERYWLYLGGYDIRKNVEYLIKAYAAVRNSCCCPPLVLAGKIPTRIHPTLCNPQGAVQACGLLPEHVRFPGYIADDDLPGLYAGAELFIYPSKGEGFGLPPLEAISCGCPAIVGDNSSLVEVVKDDQYRFSTEDPMVLQGLLARAAKYPFPLNPSSLDFSFKKSIDKLLQVINFKESPYSCCK